MLRISATSKASFVKISIPANPGFTPITVTVAADGTKVVELQDYIDQIENNTADGIEKKGLLITASSPITCYYDIVGGGKNSVVYVLKGSNALGKQFTVPHQTSMDANEDGPSTNDFIIVATEDQTKIDILPKGDLVGHLASAGVFSITLNKGETYVGRGAFSDGKTRPGGTLVKANKPVSVSIKDESIVYPNFSCRDTGGDQLIPDRLAGNEFIVVKGWSSIAIDADYYYVYATEDNTVVSVNGVSKTTLQAGGSFAAKLTDRSCFIQTSKPSHVLHLTGYGCEIGLSVIPSISCSGIRKQKFTKPIGGVSRFYLTMIVQKESVNDFLLNGERTYIYDDSPFEEVPGTSGKWMYTRIKIHDKSLHIATDLLTLENSSGKFHASIIAGSSFQTSGYGFFSGFSSDNIDLSLTENPSSLLGNETTFCYNSNLRISAKNIDATTFTWIGPNGFSSMGAVLNINAFNTDNTGTYTITTSAPGCQAVVKSITLSIDKPVASFTAETTGCENDGVVFSSPAASGVKWLWNFGNGQNLETNQPQVTNFVYGASGNFDVQLRVGSAGGCISDAKTNTISLSSKPVAVFAPSTATCEREAILFTDASTIDNGTITKWVWNLDDDRGYRILNSNAAQGSAYSESGTRNVRLVVQSATGCWGDTTRLMNGLVVHPKPIPGFIVPEVCLADANAQFTDTSTSPDAFAEFGYTWKFNDGVSPINPGPIFSLADITSKNPSIKYMKEGQYKITLVVNARGCIDSASTAFKVNGVNPIADFEILKSTALCSDAAVSIKNNSSVPVFGDITRLEVFWDKEDLSKMTIDEDPFPGKIYSYKYPAFNSPASKKYTILLRVFSGNAASCSNEITKEMELTAKPRLVFDPMESLCLNAEPKKITEARNSPSIDGSFIFSGVGVNADGFFDPADAGVGEHPIKFIFSTPNQVCIDSISMPIKVLALPIADFEVGNIQCEKNPIIFKNKSQAIEGNLEEWRWDFGSNSAAQTRNNGDAITHTFTGSGTYTTSLVVASSNGCRSNIKEIMININPLPKLAFELPKVCLPAAKAIFENRTNIDDGSIIRYRWDFGDTQDRSASVIANGIHTYTALGRYKVKLIASSIKNCTDSLEQIFEGVYPAPRAGFSSQDSACTGKNIDFADSSKVAQGDFKDWFWDLGDRTTQFERNFSHRYINAGKYTISLFAKTTIGCFSDTIKKTIEIFDYPKISAGPDLMVLDDGQKKLQATASGNKLVYTWSPSLYLSDSAVLSPLVVNPQQDQVYTLQVVGRGNCSISDEVMMRVLKLPRPPNTFTPNNDGVNDTWDIPYLDQYTESILEVYTPQGQLVFRSVGYAKQWDGTYKGSYLPAGTYYYVLDPRNGRKKISSFVTIFR